MKTYVTLFCNCVLYHILLLFIAMSTEKIILHLTQKSLNVNDKDILTELMNLVFKINFVDQNNKTFNVYANDERFNK